MNRAVAVANPKRVATLNAEWAARASRRALRSPCVALVHVPGQSWTYLESERHTPERVRALGHLMLAFDDGFCTARLGGATSYYDRRSRIPPIDRYAAMRDYCMQYTDDEILAARVAMSLQWPVWEA
jgi:hypothetical protein